MKSLIIACILFVTYSSASAEVVCSAMHGDMQGEVMFLSLIDGSDNIQQKYTLNSGQTDLGVHEAYTIIVDRTSNNIIVAVGDTQILLKLKAAFDSDEFFQFERIEVDGSFVLLQCQK